MIDGQHTAIAAASHPDIALIPVMVVEAVDQAERAGAFIGHNRDRLNITPMQMHYAAVAAGDEDALTVEQVCARAGVKILRLRADGGVNDRPQSPHMGGTSGMNLGTNNEAAGRLASFIERIERLRAEKKQLSLDEGAVVAEAKSEGFDGGAIKAVIKIRGMKPHERQESEAILDTYLHAMGLAEEPPLFRQIGLIGADIASRDSVVEAMKALVPENGSITVETKDGRPVRLTRDRDGKVSVTEVQEPKPAATPAAARRAVVERPEAPDVDADGAEALGREAFRANTPIIQNPFPFADPRRGRWDAGWRRESGGDGMGPDRGA